MTINQMLDLSCSNLAKMTLNGNVTGEIALFCDGSSATDRLQGLVAIAYDGTNSAKFPIIKLASANGQSELVVAGADKFPVSMDQFMNKLSDTQKMVVDSGDVKITNSLLATTPKRDDTFLECYKLQQNITTKISILRISDDIIQDDCFIRLSTSPSILFSYRVLTPGEPANDDNSHGERIVFLVETAPSTVYAFDVWHLSTANHGFPSITEGKMKAQPAAVAKQYFKTVTGE